MELAAFEKIARGILQQQGIDIRFGENTGFSLPVVLRRDAAQYDAMFLYDLPPDGPDAYSPRPFAWVLLDGVTGNVSLLCRCELVDFMPAGRYADGVPLPMSLPKPLNGKKLAALREKLMEVYEQIRGFAFEEELGRKQASLVSEYKDLFTRLTYTAHYPFYHALSPAFFHWLRMPLPKEALLEPSRMTSELARDGYQLLILENLQQLVKQFQEKIFVDDHKQKLFDEMHRELQQFRNGMVDNLTLPMERDIIQVIDSVEKSVGLFREKDSDAENYHKLLALLEGIETDLTDLLYRHGVEPYSVDALDVNRQKIVQSIPSENPEQDKQISARLGRGWEKDGKIIRPERVSVYTCKSKTADESKQTPDDQTARKNNV